jgi:hypothetical protein
LEHFGDYYFELETVIILKDRINGLVLPDLIYSFAVVELSFGFKKEFGKWGAS